MSAPKRKPARKPREKNGWALVWSDTGYIEGLLWATKARARRYADSAYADGHLIRVERARLILDPQRATKGRKAKP